MSQRIWLLQNNDQWLGASSPSRSNRRPQRLLNQCTAPRAIDAASSVTSGSTIDRHTTTGYSLVCKQRQQDIYELIKANQAQFKVHTMCKHLQVSRRSYYDWLGRKPTVRQIVNAELIARIKEIHAQSDKLMEYLVSMPC